MTCNRLVVVLAWQSSRLQRSSRGWLERIISARKNTNTALGSDISRADGVPVNKHRRRRRSLQGNARHENRSPFYKNLKIYYLSHSCRSTTHDMEWSGRSPRTLIVFNSFRWELLLLSRDSVCTEFYLTRGLIPAQQTCRSACRSLWQKNPQPTVED